MRQTRPLSLFVATLVAVAALAPAAQARHHRHLHAHAAKPVLIPAHQRPDYVGLAGAPVPGLIDVGYGPIFPFEGLSTR